MSRPFIIRNIAVTGTQKGEGRGNDNPGSFQINLILTNARYFKTCSLYKFKIQPPKVLLQSFRVFFHSFGVYI